MVYSIFKWFTSWNNGLVPVIVMGSLFSFVFGGCQKVDSAIGERPVTNQELQHISIPIEDSGVQQGVDRDAFIEEKARYLAIASIMVDAAEAIVRDLETFPSRGRLYKALSPNHLMRHIGNHYGALLGVGVGLLAGLSLVIRSYSFAPYPELYLTDYLNMSTEFCAGEHHFYYPDHDEDIYLNPVFFNREAGQYPELCNLNGSAYSNDEWRNLYSFVAKSGKLWAMCKRGCNQLYQTFGKWDTQSLFPASCNKALAWDKNRSIAMNSSTSVQLDYLLNNTIRALLDHSLDDNVTYDSVTYTYVPWHVPGPKAKRGNYRIMLRAFQGCADLFSNSTSLLTELTSQQNHAMEMVSWGVWTTGLGLALLPFIPYVKACWQGTEDSKSIKGLLAKVKFELRDITQQDSWHNLLAINNRILTLWNDIEFELGQKKVKIYDLEGSDRVAADKCVEAMIEGLRLCKGKMEQERLRLFQMADHGSLWSHYADCSDLVRQSMALLDKMAKSCEEMKVQERWI